MTGKRSPLRLRYTLEQRDTVTAFLGLFNLRRVDAVRLSAALALAVIVLVGVGLLRDQRALLFGGLGLVGVAGILFAMIRKSYAGLSEQQRQCIWSFGEDITIGNAVESSSLPWSAVEGWSESEAQVYLKVSDGFPLMIPKRAVSEETLFELRTMFHQRIQDQGRPSTIVNLRRWVPFLIAGLLVIVGLVVYPAFVSL
ncbi:MAG: YcxB family protein [Myxococcota bacterium]